MNLTPRYTDSHKYPHGYRMACDTDIGKTFERIRRQLVYADSAPCRLPYVSAYSRVK